MGAGGLALPGMRPSRHQSDVAEQAAAAHRMMPFLCSAGLILVNGTFWAVAARGRREMQARYPAAGLRSQAAGCRREATKLLQNHDKTQLQAAATMCRHSPTDGDGQPLAPAGSSPLSATSASTRARKSAALGSMLPLLGLRGACRGSPRAVRRLDGALLAPSGWRPRRLPRALCTLDPRLGQPPQHAGTGGGPADARANSGRWLSCRAEPTTR